jgi:nucleoside-diphosphate-sugar epimerase
MNTLGPSDIPVLVTGAQGRIGRVLQTLWHGNSTGFQPVLWCGRRPGPGVDLVWDIGQNPPPALPNGAIFLHLAGLVRGMPEELAANATLTSALCSAARSTKAVHVFTMSSAAIYAPSPHDLPETAQPAPLSPYGASKLLAEQIAEQALSGAQTRLTQLRLANLAGADALLGNCRPGVPVTLDPIAGQNGGPERSYIGPQVLADVLAHLIHPSNTPLPGTLNLAQPGPVFMADLLDAMGQPWSFGPPRPAAIPRVVLDTRRLAALVPLPPATPASLIADLKLMPQ